MSAPTRAGSRSASATCCSTWSRRQLDTSGISMCCVSTSTAPRANNARTLAGMARWNELDRYLIITSDAHAGAAMADYKPYLEAQWHDEFDTWIAGVVMPWVDVNDTTNWDNDRRIANMDADGVSAEIIFPNTLPPFFDILAHLTGVPRDAATLEHKWAGLQAHNRWLADFCSQAPVRRRGIFQLLPNDLDAAVAEM